MIKLEKLFTSRGRVNFSIRNENAYGFVRVGEGVVYLHVDVENGAYIGDVDRRVFVAFLRGAISFADLFDVLVESDSHGYVDKDGYYVQPVMTFDEATRFLAVGRNKATTKISDYVIDCLANEAEANRLESKKNWYGADYIRDEFDANWEDWIESLPAPVWEAVKRVRSQAIRMMWRVGYDRALLAVSLLANGEHLF